MNSIKIISEKLFEDPKMFPTWTFAAFEYFIETRRFEIILNHSGFAEKRPLQTAACPW